MITPRNRSLRSRFRGDPDPSRRLTLLFSAALLGTHVVVILALSQLSPLAVVAYVLLTTAGLLYLSVLRMRAQRRPPGATCDCCTSTVYDPVTVVDEVVR
ncbi:MAG: hypothetical protein M3P04_14250 [Actinomycetota bacterium]|nr:hypothetical protein [Actinomycetota bacterium]